MLRVLYLVPDLSDPAVRRRVLMLRAGGAEVVLAGFRRGENSLAAIEGIVPVELGATQDARFAQRLLAVIGASATLSRRLGGIARPDVVIARNLEMLALAGRAAARFGGTVPIAYECLDVHRLLLRKDAVGRALRAAEGYFGRRAGLLVTSSPAFVEHYFKPLSKIRAPVHLLENQVLELDGESPVPARAKPEGEPWRIGWFGAIRCRRSLDLLSTFTRHMDGRFEVVLRGRPARSEFDDFDGLVAREPFIRFEGPYRNPEDLAAIYAEVDFAWAIDFFEEGQNSRWLLPNRLYEGCRHGALPIVLSGTETARLAVERGVGLALDDAQPETLAERFAAFDHGAYRALHANLMQLGSRPWTIDRADCAAFVQRLASLRQPGAYSASPSSDPAGAQPVAARPTPSLVANKVDCHDR